MSTLADITNPRPAARAERPDSTDAAYWRAVVARDRAWDGRFVYAVRSTGVFCRPTCPSRRPGRGQVTFFPTPDAAARDGYRPCRRCRPDRPAAPDVQADRVRDACRFIQQNVTESVPLDRLAARAGVSPYHLQRSFKRLLGVTPAQYAEACRLERLKADLRGGRDVTGSVYRAGYGSASRVYERSDGRLGMTPATYGRGGRGVAIVYTIVDCPLGRLLVAGTERGVCAVYLGDTDAELAAELAAEFPAADRRRGDGAVAAWADAVVRQLDGAEPHAALPLDVRATAFQRRVWQELQKIPRGQTRTYQQIAAALGHPKAARAVGRACATNPASLVIPCHRAVRGDGGMGGYRWGVGRKQELLARERGRTSAGDRT